MQILYNGVDILPKVQLYSCEVTDHAEGRSDSAKIVFDDVRGEWDSWNPQKTHSVEGKEGAFSTGYLYVDEIQRKNGYLTIIGLSTPKSIKTRGERYWENAGISVIAQEIASAHGLGLSAYGVSSEPYVRVDQQNQRDLEYLAYRGRLEGLGVKVHNRTVQLYNLEEFEKKAPVKTITQLDFDGQPNFKNRSQEIFQSCTVSGMEYTGEYTDPSVPEGSELLYTGMTLDSIGQAQRFAKNLLKAKNRFQFTGRFTTPLLSGIGAANVIAVEFGLASGLYFVETVTHSFTDKRSRFSVRKV